MRLQSFASSHSSIYNHFNQDRHLSTRDRFKSNLAAVLKEWQTLLDATWWTSPPFAFRGSFVLIWRHQYPCYHPHVSSPQQSITHWYTRQKCCNWTMKMSNQSTGCMVATSSNHQHYKLVWLVNRDLRLCPKTSLYLSENKQQKSLHTPKTRTHRTPAPNLAKITKSKKAVVEGVGFEPT